MAFLIDANVLVTAQNLHYGFDFCPGYWDWLIHANANGEVFSIARVLQEFAAFEAEDDLKLWANERGDEFFLPLDIMSHSALGTVANYVQNLPAPFDQTGKTAFLSGADPLLVAYALAHGHTIVTLEKYIQGPTKKIKIPNVCGHFQISVATPTEMLRQCGAQFQWRPNPC